MTPNRFFVGSERNKGLTLPALTGERDGATQADDEEALRMISLLDHFVWNGAATSQFFTPWVPFPASYRRAEIWVDTKLTDGANTVSLELQSSIDQTGTEAVTTGLSTETSTGPKSSELSAKLGPWIRLKVSTSTAAGNTMFSVWLIPKND